MISFPSATLLHQRFSKEAFYNNMQLSSELKASFVTDVDRIYLEYGLSDSVLNLSIASNIEEILFLQFVLRKKEFNQKLVEAIARQNPHKLVFLLCYEDLMRIAIWQNKLYFSDWRPVEAVDLILKGASLDEIWDSFIEQIALTEAQADAASGMSVEERLKILDKKEKLEKQISALQQKLRKEKQFNKQVQLNAELKRLRKELEEIG